MLTAFLIYIVGFIIVYIFHKIENKEQTWDGLSRRIFVALFSWFSIFVYMIFWTIDILEYITDNKEPPKWL